MSPYIIDLENIYYKKKKKDSKYVDQILDAKRQNKYVSVLNGIRIG